MLEGAANRPAVVPYAPKACGRGDFALRVGPTADGVGDAAAPKVDVRPKTDFGAPEPELPREAGVPNMGVLEIDGETDGKGVVLLSFAKSCVGSEVSGLVSKTLGTSEEGGVPKGERLGLAATNFGTEPPNRELGRVPPPNGELSAFTDAKGDVADAKAENPF